MEDRLIDRIFTEIDDNSKLLVDLSKIVHANAAILGLVTKLVVAIILFIVITSLGALYSHLKTGPIYNRQIAPIEDNIKTYGIKSDPPDDTSKEGRM